MLDLWEAKLSRIVAGGEGQPAKKLRRGPGAGRERRRFDVAQSLLLSLAMDPHDKRQVKLGVGHYDARQVGDKIVLHAKGETPTPNYKVWLRAAADPKAAIHELWWLEPVGATVVLPTPFSAHTSFRAAPDTKSVRVRDAKGVHEVAVEAVAPAPAAAPSKALVYLHYANQFDLDYKGKTISFTQSNIAGDPMITCDDRYFYGSQITKLTTALGDLVTVVLEQRGEAERWSLTLLLPPTWVSGYEASTIEALVFETLTRSPSAGPPAGQEIDYELVTKVRGRASFLVS